MARYFIYLAYNGEKFCGWQIQPNGISVQEELEKALTTLLREPIQIIGAGRTDAGVHAKLMVAHFNTEKVFDQSILCDKVNRIVSRDIALMKIVPVATEAHARFDATRRGYEYWVSNAKDPFNYPFVHKFHGPMDFDKMNEACKILFEYIDFTSFSKLHTDVKTNNCIIYRAEWIQQNEHVWVFHIEANRFLRNMVRAIVGTLVEVGRGKLTLEGFRKVIEQKDRCVAGSSMPGHALYLCTIEYPETLFLNSNN